MFSHITSRLRARFRPKPTLSRLDPADQQMIATLRARNLTYLSDSKLISLVDTCRNIQTRHIAGDYIETGCALGGSAILIASIKEDAREFSVYDVFGMIPPPTAEDPPIVHDRYTTIKEGLSEGIGGDKYYGYETDLVSVVQSNLRACGIDLERQRVSLVKGLVQDTLRPDAPIAFAHIDVDWYEPVKVCLERIIPQLSRGGSIILDDYHDWGGCKRATDELMSGLSRQFVMDDSMGSMKITRVRK